MTPALCRNALARCRAGTTSQLLSHFLAKRVIDSRLVTLALRLEILKHVRVYSLQFKREVVAQCLAPGASVSAIALSHRINATMIIHQGALSDRCTGNHG